jgi:hypothetical protein
MSEFYNPDYPVSNTGGFSQHLYHPEQNNSAFYYGGTGYDFNFSSNPYNFNSNPFNNTVQPDSRRNDGLNPQIMPQVPTMPTMPTMSGVTTYPQAEKGVMPFSSYPSTSQSPQYGFNSLVESRRFDNQPTDMGNNPWANPQPAQMPAPIVSQPTTPSAWSYQPNPTYYNDPSCAALYTNQKFGFDRSTSAWNNMYSTPRQIAPPNIDWNRGTQQPINQYAQPPVYPAFSNTQAPVSWKDVADRNWGGSGI